MSEETERRQAGAADLVGADGLRLVARRIVRESVRALRQWRSRFLRCVAAEAPPTSNRAVADRNASSSTITLALAAASAASWASSSSPVRPSRAWATRSSASAAASTTSSAAKASLAMRPMVCSSRGSSTVFSVGAVEVAGPALQQRLGVAQDGTDDAGIDRGHEDLGERRRIGLQEARIVLLEDHLVRMDAAHW